VKLIYSKIQPEKLLHIIHRFDEINNRTDVCPPEQFIQLATLKMQKDKTFKPHKHIFKQGEKEVIAQESWVVIQGSVKVILYDLDDQIIAEEIINKGDCSITFEGGHNYYILEDDTVVYEYKTGPYKGQLLDKEFIGD
jgi:cupin fold WbuC family metalloprotein